MEFEMHWQQWTIVIGWALSILLSAALHGKPRTGNYDVLTVIISAAISFWILYSAGFFGG